MTYKRLLSPRSIVVYGGTVAEELIRQCDRMGYEGAIWPVHPVKKEIQGRKAFRSTDELPGSPDAAYIAVNRHATIDIVGQLAAIGAGGAVTYATGFMEAGEEGASLQSSLLEASAGMPLIGPNCYGLLNYIDGAMLWPDQQGGRRVEEGVAIITMSSNVGFNLTMQRRGLKVAYMVSLGNRLKFDLHDAIQTFAQDPCVTAIGLYLEAIDHPASFEEAILAARALGKPVVAIKTGRSEISKSMVISHTSSLAGSDELIDALFSRCGVARVDSLEALVEALKVMHVCGPLKGGRLGVMSTSGGDLSLISDAMADLSLSLPPLTTESVDRIRPTVHERTVVANPFDYQMFDWNNEKRLTPTFLAFLSQGFDISLSLLDYPRADKCDASHWGGAQRAFINAAKQTGAAAAILATFTDTLPELLAEQLLDDGIVPLAGIQAGLAGIQAAVDVGRVEQRSDCRPLLPVFKPAQGHQVEVIDEADSKRLLAKYGIPVPRSITVKSADEAVSAAETLGYPVVVKALGVAHKTEVGGVVLNLVKADEVAMAVNSMSHLSQRFLVEQMVNGAVAELIIGVARDEQFGPYLVVGSGGIFVELLQDSRSLLFPITRDEVLDALESLKCAPMFHGFRGQPQCDLAAAVDVVEAVGAFVEDHLSTIAELDINPLMLMSKGQGVIAADALITLYKDKDDHDKD